MANEHPPIDRRGPNELIAEVEGLVEQKTPWRRSPGDRLDALGALLRVFSRMAVHAVDALNRAPEQNFLSFLHLVGEKPRPPLAARAPLRFELAEGASQPASVPARTPIAAEDDDTVVFETVAPLVVSDVPLVAAFARDPGADRHADLSALLDPEGSPARPLLTGDVPLPHALHVGGGARFAYDDLQAITVALDFSGLTAQAIAELPLAWSAFDGADWRPLTTQITTAAVDAATTRLKTRLTGLPALPLAVLAGARDRWVRASLRADALVGWWKVHVLHNAPADLLPAADILGTLPKVRRLRLDVRSERLLFLPRRAALAGSDLDLTKDFWPFGQEPRFGDTLYLDPCPPDTLPRLARVTLDVTLSAAPPVAPKASDKLQLTWECHTAAGWRELGRTTLAAVTSAADVGFTDTTKALTAGGKLEFRLPDAPRPGPGEAAGAWLRARITAGDYGVSAWVDATKTPPVLVPSNLAPPVLGKLLASYVVDDLDAAATSCFSRDDFVDRERLAALSQGQQIPLFTRSGDSSPALYLGFERSIGQVPTSLFFQTCPLDPVDAGRPGGDDPPRITWEYRAPGGWRPLVVEDETEHMTTLGVVRVAVPPDHTAAADFERTLFWIRARHVRGQFRGKPRADRLAQNVVWARHATSVVGEILGSGAGSGAQSFTAARPPVLNAEVLEVRERAGLSLPEARDFAAPLGRDATLVDEGPFGTSVWVRWWLVTDFRGSGPEHRHYLLDRSSGRVDFGDGVRGRAAPSGQANIRMSYETGGGAAGNAAAGTLSKLKASLASIAGVANLIPALGGADAETTAEFAARSPTALRHRGRAVAAADFEDLAFAASPEVARALAIAARADPIAVSVDLSGQPDLAGGDVRVKLDQVPAYTASAAQKAGRVRVVVVARGDQARPSPSAGLLDHLARHLRARCAPGLVVEVTGPRWVEVRVTARLVAASQDRAQGLVDAARVAVDRFLHPLTGGLDGRGWPFGRVPRRSDINRILAGVPGVDHVRGLVVACDPPPPDLDDALSDDELNDLASLMVFAGPHDLSLAGVIGEMP